MTNKSYNLIDEPYIPCVMPDGKRRDWSLRECLHHAPEIAEIRDDSPLVTFSQHRLLLAILHRVFGPKNLAEWEKLWTSGHFDRKRIDAYLQKWHSRFDLLDEDYPFYQVRDFTAKKPSGLSRLARELARGNNPTLFDHTFDDATPVMTLAQIARYVIAEQSYALAGGKSDGGIEKLTDSPLARSLCVMAQGANLFETLVLNFVVYNEREPFPGNHDAPAWERPTDPIRDNPMPRGYLDLLTWQSRTLRVQPELQGKSVKIEKISYAQGRTFSGEGVAIDPTQTFYRDKRNGYRAVKIDENRSLWRDSAALFHFSDSHKIRGPESLRMLSGLVGRGVLQPGMQFNVAMIGLCATKAAVHFWRHERIPLPLAYLKDANLVESLTTALGEATKTAANLHSAVQEVARACLSDHHRKSSTDHKSDHAKAMVSSMAAEPLFWSRLEIPFRNLMNDLPHEITGDQGLLAGWVVKVVCQTAREVFNETAGRLDSTGRQIQAVAQGDLHLNGWLSQISKPWKEILDGQYVAGRT